MLELESVTFGYGPAPTYDFTMVALPGEITAIRGASGSGKSTLLDLIAGFLRPSTGTIRIAGHDVTEQPPEQRPVSILFQSETLFEHLSASRNVALGLAHPDPERVAKVLAELDLSDLAAQRAGSLSGGQKQRVALARTLLRDRPVLLLDEPFSALDDDTRMATRALVQSLTRKQKWATVLVTHHADDIGAIADRVYRLEGGRLAR